MNGSDIVERLRTAGEDFLGRFAETVWENIFRASGVRFIPLAKLAMGGAPRVDGTTERTVLPDYDCAGNDWAAYIDSKCKSGPVFYRRTKKYRHGIDLKNWQAYKRTGEIFKKPAGLGIVELWTDFDARREWSGALLVERFKELGEPFYGESNQAHMVYWNRKAFHDLDCLSPEELLAAYRGQPPRRYSLELQQIFAPRKQGDLFGGAA